LYPFIPFYPLLRDSKYGHFGIPFLFYSKVVFTSPLVSNVRLSDLVPLTKNGSNSPLQEVKLEQLKTTSDSKSLQPRSGYFARLKDKLRKMPTSRMLKL
jgi:hypothetical protein